MEVLLDIELKGITHKEYETLFREHYAALCAYANKYVEDQDAAEEIVQDVFFKLWVKRNEIDIQSSLKSYLFRAVRNASLNLISHLKVRDDYKHANEKTRDLEEQQDDDALVGTELEQRIRLAIDQLPEQRKRIFIMSRYEDLKYKEIAEKLDVSIKTVENQMGKALKYLRAELHEYLPLIALFCIHIFKNDIG